MKIGFESSDADIAADILNGYVEFALNKMHASMRETVQMTISAQLVQWRIQVEQFRQEYHTAKARRLLALQEAYEIAKTIQQDKPVYNNGGSFIGMEPPLYMLGIKALSAEIKQLSERKSEVEDGYIEGVPELLWKINEVENMKINWDQLQYIQIDQPAVAPQQPIKPKKLLVIALAMVAGGMMGTLLALIAAASHRRKQRQAEQ